MILLEPQPHPVAELERLHVRPGQLQAAGPVEDCELLGDDSMLARVVDALSEPLSQLGAAAAGQV